MASTPGHFMHVELIGDITIVHKGQGGRIRGVLLRVNLGEAIDIAIIADRWPEGVCEGARLAVRGHLGQEREVLHRKNIHFVQAHHLSIVRRWQPRT